MKKRLFSRQYLAATLAVVIPCQIFSASKNEGGFDTLAVSPVVYNHTVTKASGEGPLPSLFSKYINFDDEPSGQTARFTEWDIFNDKKAGGNSIINDTCAVINDLTNLFTPKWIDASGCSKDGSDEGKACMLRYTIGDSITVNGVKKCGYTGMGNNFYDTVDYEYWNAIQSTSKSVYFNYKTSGDIDRITFEIYDGLDVSEIVKPDIPAHFRGRGYREIPMSVKDSTGQSMWMAINIRLDSLIYESFYPDSNFTELDRYRFARFQWKVEGAKGSSGTFLVDNIYFPGPSDCYCGEGDDDDSDDAVVQKFIGHDRTSGIIFTNNTISFSMDSDHALKSGRASITNMQGKTVFSAPLSLSGNKNTCSIATGTLPCGVYILRINGKNLKNEPVNIVSGVNIMK